MKVLVFGGSGFVGSHVCDVMSEKGVDLTVYDIKESPYLKPGQKMVIGDLSELDKMRECIEESDYVLNYAGIAGLDEAQNNPSLAVQTNILGNLNILECLRKSSVKRYIFASTYYVYSEHGSIYRVTKQSCELFIEEYSRLYDIPFTILRYGSLYGPRSPETNGVRIFLEQALKQRKIVRAGTGDAIRDYIHVLDSANATYEVMLDKDYKNRHVILAGNQGIKIKDLMFMIKEMMGGDIEIEYTGEEKQDSGHYNITPYSFKPQHAVRYMRKDYFDLGQGLLQMMYELDPNAGEKTQ